MQDPVIQVQPVSASDFRHQPVMAPRPKENRDPNGLNDRVQIVWDDIIGEPEGSHSPYWVWSLSRGCFRFSSKAVYTILTILMGPCLALGLGCCFSCIAFEQIWCVTPYLRFVKISYAVIRSIMTSFLAAIIAPCAEAVGRIFMHIRINVKNNAPEDKDVLCV